jgi:hypothetical protein
LALNDASHTSPAAKAFVKIAEQVARRWER